MIANTSDIMQWSFAEIWNNSLLEDNGRKFEARDYIWASELGGSMCDRYLKMTGVEPTNPPNMRSKRKFEAGNIWESIVGYVLLRAGILQKKQEHLTHQYDGLLKVTGKLDFQAGGKPDYEKAVAIANDLDWLPEFIKTATINIVKGLQEKFPDGLQDIVLEIKSCSSYMFERAENLGAQPQHKLQLFHYLKSKNMPEGHIVYVCKDDARLIEIGIRQPSTVELDYKKDIETLTRYYNAKQRPPIEQPITFDGDRFTANWKVGYSQYLTMLYGLKSQMEFDDAYKPTVERWNRVLGRVKNNDKMTDKNLEALEEMQKAGFDVNNIKTLIGV